MEKKGRERIKTGVIIALALVVIITGYYAYSLREQYLNSNLNTYNESFTSVVDYVNRIEKYLAKAMISKSPEYSAQTLTKIWGDSNLAMAYLTHVPVNNDGLSQTARFLNQLSDYSYSLSRKSINNEELTEEDFNNLQKLHQYCIELETTLNQISSDLNDGNIAWSELTNKDDLKFAQAVDNVSVFSSIDSNFEEYEGLIYDGAYSDHVEKAEKKGLTGNDITEEQAEEIVKKYYGAENIKKINRNGLIEKANIPEYDFTVEFNGSKDNASIGMSKKGGHVVQAERDREVKESKISKEDAKKIGKDFLASHDFKNMETTYCSITENIITVNYAYSQDGIIVYPDLIKVKMALDNGEVLGIETTGYLNSHEKRKIQEKKITLEQAKEKLNPKLRVEKERVAIIPTKWKTEILCYEFKGKVEENDFLVYINCQTGKEEDILVILDTEKGEITM